MRTFFEADVWAERAREGASAEGGEMFLPAVRRPRVVLQVLQRLQGEFLLDAGSRARGGNRKGAPRLKKGIHRRELLHQRALGLFGSGRSVDYRRQRDGHHSRVEQNMRCRTRGSGETHRLVREHGLGDPAPVAKTSMKRRLPSRGEPIFRRAVQQELIPEEEFVRGVHARGFTSRIAERVMDFRERGPRERRELALARQSSRSYSRYSRRIYASFESVCVGSARRCGVPESITSLCSPHATRPFPLYRGTRQYLLHRSTKRGSQTLVGVPLFESMRESDSIGSPSS